MDTPEVLGLQAYFYVSGWDEKIRLGLQVQINPAPDAFRWQSAYSGDVIEQGKCPMPDKEIQMNAILTRKSILTAIVDAYDELTSRKQTVSEYGVWGFINENELAEEMSNSQPDPGALSSTFEPNVDDFEKVYCWFLS